MLSYTGILLISSSVLLIYPSDAFLSWIFNAKSPDTEEISGDNDRRVPLLKAETPFEMTISDEKFLLEQHLTKDLSPLDTCHHLVISEIKSTCTSLTEEELGKLAVQLLNCQSDAEGRTTFPCTKQMSLGECTKPMDATTWNAYQITSNRARAICYSTRQQQFRKKTEYTVNRLIQTTEGQIHAMSHIREGQEKINQATADTLEKMESGQTELLGRQQQLKSAQMNIHTYIASNLRELTREKSLIAAGNKELADMTESIRKKLDNATKKLENYEKSQKGNHEEVLNDLATIREKARSVWDKIDDSSKNMLQYHNDTTRHYMETLENLRRVNETISFILNTIGSLEESIDKKLGWISTHLGGTGDRLSLLSTVVLHALYFLMAAVSVSFLQTPLFSRVVLLLLVPLNAWSEVKHHQSLGFTAMTLFILLIVFVNWFAEWVIHRHQAKKATRARAAMFSASSFGSASDLDTPMALLAPFSTPETPVFGSLRATQNGLSTPDLRKLVMVIETLCKQGILSPTSPVSVSGDRGEHAHVANVSTCVDAESEADRDSPRNTTLPDTTDSNETPHDVTAPMPRMSALDTSLNRDITDSAKARVELVRRRLLSSPVPDSPLARHRGSTPRSSLARASPSRSSPARSSARSSRASTPRPACSALTKAGMPCRNTCADSSNYCFRHHPDRDDSD